MGRRKSCGRPVPYGSGARSFPAVRSGSRDRFRPARDLRGCFLSAGEPNYCYWMNSDLSSYLSTHFPAVACLPFEPIITSRDLLFNTEKYLRERCFGDDRRYACAVLENRNKKGTPAHTEIPIDRSGETRTRGLHVPNNESHLLLSAYPYYINVFSHCHESESTP